MPEVKLYHKYSETNEKHTFGIVIPNDPQLNFTTKFINWLSVFVHTDDETADITLCPQKTGELIYTYKPRVDEVMQAQMMANRINTILSHY